MTPVLTHISYVQLLPGPIILCTNFNDGLWQFSLLGSLINVMRPHCSQTLKVMVSLTSLNFLQYCFYIPFQTDQIDFFLKRIYVTEQVWLLFKIMQRYFYLNLFNLAAVKVHDCISFN